MRAWRVAASIAAVFAAPSAGAQFDPAPWLADLEQARQAFHEKYANWDWAESEREVKIDPLFDDLANRLRETRNEAAAHAVFERLQRQLGDGHVEIDWPDQPLAARTGSAKSAAPDLCNEIGYDARQN